MAVLHITPEKWIKKTAEEKEHLRTEIQELIHEFRIQGRGEEWHISSFMNALSKPDGVENMLKYGQIIFLAIKEERVIGIMQFIPQDKHILVQFGLTRPRNERSRVGRQLLAAVNGYSRAHKFEGIEFTGQSPAGRNFVTTQLDPKPYYRRGKRMEGEHVVVQSQNGSIHVKRNYGPKPPLPPRKSPLQWLRNWFSRRR